MFSAQWWPFLFMMYVKLLSLRDQSGTKPNSVAKILATNFGVFYVIYAMF